MISEVLVPHPRNLSWWNLRLRLPPNGNCRNLGDLSLNDILLLSDTIPVFLGAISESTEWIFMALNYTEIDFIINMESIFQKGQGTKLFIWPKSWLVKKTWTHSFKPQLYFSERTHQVFCGESHCKQHDFVAWIGVISMLANFFQTLTYFQKLLNGQQWSKQGSLCIYV